MGFEFKLHLTEIPPKRQSALAAMVILSKIIATMARPSATWRYSFSSRGVELRPRSRPTGCNRRGRGSLVVAIGVKAGHTPWHTLCHLHRDSSTVCVYQHTNYGAPFTQVEGPKCAPARY